VHEVKRKLEYLKRIWVNTVNVQRDDAGVQRPDKIMVTMV
jgi:hypothetical protein